MGQKFDSIDADVIRHLSKAELDALPFGAIQLDEHDRVVRYNATEADLARRSVEETIGRHFFKQVAPCTDKQGFRGKLHALTPENPSSTTDYTFRFAWGEQRVRVRFMLASDSTRWVFVSKL